MKQSCRKNTFRYLYVGRNLLAHLLCLLLIFSMPALAQSGCDTNFAHMSSAPDATCVDLVNDDIWDSRTLSERTISRTYEPSSGLCGLGQTVYETRPLSDTYLLGAGPSFDIGAVQSVGTDAATLRPEAIDLEIFPSIKISDQLSLKPSLSYSEDVCMSRLGLVHYGAPKGWRNHYGELVIMLSGTIQSRTPINKADISNTAPGPQDPLLPEAREIQLFFVNATGNQVNFYPDPADFSINPVQNVDTPLVDNLRYWYSNQGNYRLEDKNYAENHTSANNTFLFELKTPGGLIYEFERYQVHLGQSKESMALRYRVTKIQDRYGNFLELDYLDRNGVKDLRPTTVKAYRLDESMTPPNPVHLHTLNYTYLADDRLASVDMPGFGNAGTRNFYHFYYPDTGLLHPGMPARHTLSNATSGSVSINPSNRALFEPIATNIDAFFNLYSKRLFIDFEAMGFAPEPMLDYDTLSDFDFEDFASAGYGFVYKYGTNSEGFAFGDSAARQGIKYNSRFGGVPGLKYRFQISTYADGIPDFWDTITLSEDFVGDDFPGLNDDVKIDVYPMLKDGDAVVWVEGNQLKSSDVILGHGDSISQTDYSVKLGNGDTPSVSATQVRLVREDNRDRIAEIQFPTSTGSSHKRMLIGYDDRSVNHQEIKKIQIYDVKNNDAQLLTETNYEYEQTLVLSVSREMEEVLPKETGIDKALWQNCLEDRFLRLINKGSGGTLGLHELVDMMRRKETRYLKSWLPLGDEVSDDAYQTLTTHYGGAYHFALMGLSFHDENDPQTPPIRCDDIGWSLASKPFSFTWQIHPDGTGTVYDLSPKGLGVEPALAHANRRRRVFKTYQFDNRFKDYFLDGGAFSSYTKFGNQDRFTPFYHYFPSYEPADPCVGCSADPKMVDLINNPQLPATKSPTLAELFAGNATCHTANWTTFELVPIYNYAMDTDATHNTRFQRRWTIKALYGDIHEVEGEDRYMRLNPITAIAKDPTVTNKEAAVETFFRGDLSTCATEGTSGLLPIGTINWTYGGRLDLGSVFQYYHDRQKTHKLLPHAKVTAQKLAGFDWHSSGMVDLDWSNGTSPWIVQASRASNGGYLGLGEAETAALVGDTTLDLKGAPESVSEGDVFFFGNAIHSITQPPTTTTDPITSEVTTSITFEPSLRKSVSLNQKIGLHRFFRGSFANNGPTFTPGYHGYDAFGNNAYQAVYKKDHLKLPSPSDDPEHALVPDFFGTGIEPFQITLTDATLPANNDTSEWNFFGRVTKRYTGHQLPFRDYATAPTPPETSYPEKSGWDTGQWTTKTFSGNPYPWTPTQEVTWFRPKELTLSSPNGFSPGDFSGQTNPQSHGEDRRTEIRYFADTSSGAQIHHNTLTHGRPYLIWTVMGVHAASQLDQTPVDIQRFAYDSRGRLDNVANNIFRRDNSAWVNPYGTLTTYDYSTNNQDSLMDLPTVTTLKSTKATWDPGQSVLSNRFQVTSDISEGSSHVTYDELGRLLSSETKDASGSTYGEVTTSSYPTQTKEIAMAAAPGAAQPFSTTIMYKDGLGRALTSLRKRGHSSPSFFAQVNDFDTLGRPYRTGFERDLPINTSADAFAKTARADGGSYTETVFNKRSEAFGQVIMRALDDNASNFAAESSQWTHLSQNAQGHLVTQTLRQTPGEALENDGTLPDLDGVLVKTSTLDDFGMVAQVRDDRVTPSSMSGIWTSANIASESDLSTYLPNLNGTPEARATYTYDRWENVKKVEVGNQSTIQTREFAYDQRNRLRLEKHPEMRSDGSAAVTEVAYFQYNLFDQPTLIDQGAGRTWTYDYNPAGDLVQVTTNGGITTHYTYRYDIQSNNTALRFPNLPVLIRHDEGSQVAYINEYDEQKGWLTSRTMFHEYANFQGFGYVSNLSTQNHASLSGNSQGLAMTYVYDDDDLGRVKELTYPAMVTGENDPTRLTYEFNTDDQMLASITDHAFGTPLPLVESMVYDRMDQLKEATFGQPSANNAEHKLIRTPDTLNRMASWRALWEEQNIPQLDETRAYHFNSVGNMAEITRKTGTANPAALYRYTYDSLGQIKQAWMKPDSANDADIHSFGYDSHGFGNLINIHRGEATPPPDFNLDLGTNQLSDFNFSAHGEQTSDSRDSIDYTLGYNDLGRLTSYTSDPTGDLTQAQYHYDDAGMRIHTASTDASGQQEERLYFYNDAGMVLCEWVAKPGPNGWEARWDTSSIYLEGNTAFTYTYDKAGDTQVAQGSSLPQPQILLNGLLTWPETTAPYEIEITDDQQQPRAHFRGLKSAELSLAKHVPYGKYHVRMKGLGTTWGDWQAVYFLDPAQNELAGEYGFDTSGQDHSDFKNHTAEVETLSFTHGQFFDALDFNAGETFVIPNPHAFKPVGNDGTLSVWLKLPPLPNAFVPNERKHFLDYGFISLWIRNHGTLEFKRKGAPYEAATQLMPLDTWVHLSFVYGDGHGELYIDGQLVLNVANMPPTLPPGDMVFGNSNSATGFTGLIDRLRLFNRGLSTSEIQAEATP